MRAWIFAVLALVLTAAMGCGGGKGADANLKFIGHDLSQDEEGVEVIRVELLNEGDTVFTGAEFEAEFQLRYTSKYGDLIASETVVLPGPLQPGESVVPFEWKGDLPQSGYYLWWGSDGYGGVEVEFLVQVGQGFGRAGVGGIMEMTYRELDSSGNPTGRH